MKAFAWWPVTLILLAAPFATHGWNWLDKQRIVATHARQIGELAKQAKKDSEAAYGLGRRDAAAEIRDQQRSELEQTRAALEEAERELEAERIKAAEAPAHAPSSGPSAEVRAWCQQSASCRDRRR